eukprot:CAMPEP_0118923002 /NCGR_PEP_ID=MMETSP1169-20130426/1702_1 /TAXON_ID=36882 /ORGANISM="Pyramimonas obovata, Strain CCMP722" /LENGTH=216 /DNA_ID=CAMNT_0006863933 /DNA_START=52 /DNA_END=702 /DNA_ORIENTATION=+
MTTAIKPCPTRSITDNALPSARQLGRRVVKRNNITCASKGHISNVSKIPAGRSGVDRRTPTRREIVSAASTAFLFSLSFNADAAADVQDSRKWADARWPISAPEGRGVAAQYSGVDDTESEFIQGLLKKSKDNKEQYDQDRLDRYYNREYNINKIAKKLGMDEVLPEPCDPRDPEFGSKCRAPLPSLPQDRADYDWNPNAPRVGNLLGSFDPVPPK